MKLHSINLLNEATYLRYSRHPELLENDLEQANLSKDVWIFIDEIQKVPQLLNIVHLLIESKKLKFILTGSSARKLKKGSANLLAGRAFSYKLFPLTFIELEKNFHLNEVLKWGSLPLVIDKEIEDKKDFLRTYVNTYLKEEILEEQIVRNGVAFRQFLSFAGQTNGTTLNYTKIAREIGVDTKTIQNFFQILEDTLVGFFLPAYQHSIRKSIKQQPKFYIFDLGVTRAFQHELNNELNEGTSAYGRAFEQFIILEVFRLNEYKKLDYLLYHYQTTAGGEIDLILKRGREIIAIEIKSTRKIDTVEVNKLAKASRDLKASTVFYLSQDTHSSLLEGVQCINWREFLEKKLV